MGLGGARTREEDEEEELDEDITLVFLDNDERRLRTGDGEESEDCEGSLPELAGLLRSTFGTSWSCSTIDGQLG